MPQLLLTRGLWWLWEHATTLTGMGRYGYYEGAFSPPNPTLRNMLLAQVKGHVVSSAKIDSLTGKKLLLVEIVTVRDEGLERTERHMVCVDAVGAGERELVLVVMGSSARVAPHLGDVPTDAVIVGIIDSLQAFGRDMQLADA